MEIKTIILGGFAANCYLLKTDSGFILIDTGRASKRNRLEKELIDAGCQPGDLNLIILTHGDFDHTGNCVYLGKKYQTKIAMHADDVGMVEHGDMFWKRKMGNQLVKKLINFFFKIDNFRPDLIIDENFDLSKYGLLGKVLHLPGHSKGSIGILTAQGDLFCGDLFWNTKKPEIGSLIDDSADAQRSIAKLQEFSIHQVYPGHGKPFLMSSFLASFNR